MSGERHSFQKAGAPSAQERPGIEAPELMAHPKLQPHDIGWAVKQMHNGSQVTRLGWHGKGQYVELQRPDAHSKMTQPYVYIRVVSGDYVPWVCSQADLLALDWEIM